MHFSAMTPSQEVNIATKMAGKRIWFPSDDELSSEKLVPNTGCIPCYDHRNNVKNQ
jgi:hypothetical protein